MEKRFGGGGGRGGFDRAPREMHKAVCAGCGKDCEVPFKPDGSRPVYCNECYSKSKKDKTVKSLLTPDDVDKILKLDRNNAEEFVKKAEECAKEFGISTNQLRNFYDYVKTEIGEDYKDPNNFDNDKVKLYLLKPKMAYAVGKAQNNRRMMEQMIIFQKTMELLIDKVDTKDEFENFVRFFEAIVAYHKIYHND